MTKFKPLPSLAELRHVFTYVPETGALLRKGKQAGWIESTGYRRVSWKNKHLASHRICYFLATGVDPAEKYIDHMNGDKLDNRICNLRLATNQENQRNTSKPKGYHYARGKWRACIMLNKKYKHLGYFLTEELAAAAYSKAARELFGDFYRDATV